MDDFIVDDGDKEMKKIRKNKNFQKMIMQKKLLKITKLKSKINKTNNSKKK